MNILVLYKNYFSRYKGTFRLGVLLSIITSVSAIIIPRISGKFVDSLIRDMSLEDLLRFCYLFGGVTIVSVVAGYYSNKIFVKLCTCIVFDVKKDLVDKFRNSDMFAIKRFTMSEVSQMSDRDSNFVISSILAISQNIITNTILIVFSVMILYSINFLVTVLFIGVSVIYILLYISFKRVMSEVNMQYLSAQTKYFKVYFEQFFDLEFIKNNALANLFNTYLFRAFEKFYIASMRTQKVNYSFNSLDKVCMTMAQLILFFFGGREVIRKNISVGEFTVLSTYFGLALASVRYFLSLGKTKRELDVSFDRLNSIYQLEKEENGSIEIEEIQNLEIVYSRSVLFQDESVGLKKINLIKGNIYLLKGGNGSGKTTLLNVISGLYKVRGLEYYINDIKSSEINMELSRKKNFAILEQFPRLIETSIKENIFLDLLPSESNEERFSALVKKFNLEDLCERTFERDFTNMSGGEIKKVAIVRTLLKNSEVILLDEPTASLDEYAKKVLLEILSKEKEGKIIVITSHDDDLVGISDEVIEM